MTPQERAQLYQTLLMESGQVIQMQAKHDEQAVKLDAEYKQVIQDFKFKQAPKIRAAWEEKSHDEECNRAEKLISSL